MATLEIPKSKRWSSNYRVVIEEEPQITLQNDPFEALREALQEFVGCPNDNVTRARIEAVLQRWNFVYHQHLTMNDINLD